MLVSALYQSESAIHINISPYLLPLASPSHLAFKVWSYEKIPEPSPQIHISEVFPKCLYPHLNLLLKWLPDSWLLTAAKTSIEAGNLLVLVADSWARWTYPCCLLRHLQFPTQVAFWHLPLSPGAPSRQWGSASAIYVTHVAILNSSTFSAYSGFQMALLWLLVPTPSTFSLLWMRSSCTCTEDSHYLWFLIYGFA